MSVFTLSLRSGSSGNSTYIRTDLSLIHISRILVVDDEPNIVNILRSNLEREGYKAVSYTHLDVYKRQE